MDLLNSKRLFLLTFVVALFSYSFVFGLDITNEVNGSCVYDGDSVTLSATVEPPEEVVPEELLLVVDSSLHE